MSIAYSGFVPKPARVPAQSATPRVRRLATDEELRALASTLRLRILRACLGQPRSNKEIAQVLGKDPATTLHHVRRLVDNGFLAAQPVRRGQRGSREIPYLATKKSWTLESPGKSGTMLETFLEEIALVPMETVNMSRLGLRLSAAEKDEFNTRLQALLDEFAERVDTPDGAAWSVFYASHPDPNRP
jgi:DNA-binding transcriptional ArsR family regulator